MLVGEGGRSCVMLAGYDGREQEWGRGRTVIDVKSGRHRLVFGLFGSYTVLVAMSNGGPARAVERNWA